MIKSKKTLQGGIDKWVQGPRSGDPGSLRRSKSIICFFVGDDVLKYDMAEMMTIFWKADDRFPEVGLVMG